jgi:hypothetical protein
MGDVIAEFDKEQGCSPNVGKPSLNEKADDNGWRRINFVRARSMVVSSTSLEHENIHGQSGDHQVVYP